MDISRDRKSQNAAYIHKHFSRGSHHSGRAHLPSYHHAGSKDRILLCVVSRICFLLGIQLPQIQRCAVRPKTRLFDISHQFYSHYLTQPWLESLVGGAETYSTDRLPKANQTPETTRLCSPASHPYTCIQLSDKQIDRLLDILTLGTGETDAPLVRYNVQQNVQRGGRPVDDDHTF